MCKIEVYTHTGKYTQIDAYTGAYIHVLYLEDAQRYTHKVYTHRYKHTGTYVHTYCRIYKYMRKLRNR